MVQDIVDSLCAALHAQALTAQAMFSASAAHPQLWAALGAALRDAGYPEAMESPRRLGIALRAASRTGQGERLARTSGGKWFVKSGPPSL